MATYSTGSALTGADAPATSGQLVVDVTVTGDSTATNNSLSVVNTGTQAITQLTFTINDSVFRYGHFYTAVVSFLIIAAVIFFLVVKPLNALAARRALVVRRDYCRPPDCDPRGYASGHGQRCLPRVLEGRSAGVDAPAPATGAGHRGA